jgi:hypothetical protein
MMKRCKSCGGRYEEQSREGVLYFHACPPLSVAESPGPAEQKRIEAGETLERVGKRDENVLTDAEGKRVGVKSEGKGNEEV